MSMLHPLLMTLVVLTKLERHTNVIDGIMMTQWKKRRVVQRQCMKHLLRLLLGIAIVIDKEKVMHHKRDSKSR